MRFSDRHFVAFTFLFRDKEMKIFLSFLWLMGVSRRIIFRELGKGPRKYKAKRVQKRRNCYFASREDVTYIFFPYCQILVRVELIYFSFST